MNSKKTSDPLHERLGATVSSEIAKAVIKWGVLGLGALAMSALATLPWGLPLVASIPLFVLLSCMLLALVYCVVQRLRSTKPSIPALDKDFEFLELAISYHYLTPTTMQYKRRWKLRALRSGLDSLRDKFSWTGSGEISMHCSDPHHSVSETMKHNVWQYFDVEFGRFLGKGDEIEVEVIWDLVDKKGVAVPFCSRTIDRPTKRLEMSITLPTDSRVSTVSLETARGMALGAPYRTEVRALDHKKSATWTIQRPKLGHLYQIVWRNEIPESVDVSA